MKNVQIANGRFVVVQDKFAGWAKGDLYSEKDRVVRTILELEDQVNALNKQIEDLAKYDYELLTAIDAWKYSEEDE